MAKTDLKETDAAKPAVSGEATLPPAAAETLAAFTPAGMVEAATAVAGLTSTLASSTAPPPVTSAPADVTGEIAEAGPAFGTFLSKVGMAVAETQKALDLTMVETARALSAEKVQVAAVFEQVVDDDGKLGDGKIHMQEVPLITLVTPSSLQFREVHISADMEVEEFTNATGLRIKKSHTDFNLNAKAKYGLFSGFNISGGTNLNVTSDNLDVNTSAATDKAAGKLHMEATIEPRVIPLPQPFVIQKGPRLRLLLKARRDLDASGQPTTDPAALKTREVEVVAHLVGTSGGALQKQLEVNVDGGFGFTLSATQTDATTGELTITVRRTGITPETLGLQQTSVRASMGLVTASLQFGI